MLADRVPERQAFPLADCEPPVPRKRFHRLPAEQQAHVVEVAAAEFAKLGFDGASLNAIIRSTGSSKGAFYYWFEDKHDVFIHVATRTLKPLGAAMGKPGPVGSADRFWSAVLAMFERGWDFLREDPLALGMLRAVVRAHGAGELTDAWPQFSAPIVESATEIALQGQSVNAVREDVPIDLLIAVIIGIAEAADMWFEDRIEELDEEEVSDAIDALSDVLRRVASPN